MKHNNSLTYLIKLIKMFFIIQFILDDRNSNKALGGLIKN